MQEVNPPTAQGLERRALLLGASAAVMLPGVALSSPATHVVPLTLDLQRAGQRVRLDVMTAEGYKAAAWMLRDIQANNQVGWPSPNLLVYAAHLQRALAQYHAYTVFHVTSGLRTRETNRRTEGAAQHSLHLPDANNQFHAMDLKPVGATLDQLARLAGSTSFGGVGRYESHLHLDVRTNPARW